MKYRAFISYSSEDRHLAKELAARLAGKAVDAWWDQAEEYDRSVPVGAALPEGIEASVSVCSVCIRLLSHPSLDSPWCALEARVAAAHNLHVIPVLIDRGVQERLEKPEVRCLPVDGAELRPVTLWDDRTAAWRQVVAEVVKHCALAPNDRKGTLLTDGDIRQRVAEVHGRYRKVCLVLDDDPGAGARIARELYGSSIPPGWWLPFGTVSTAAAAIEALVRCEPDAALVAVDRILLEEDAEGTPHLVDWAAPDPRYEDPGICDAAVRLQRAVQELQDLMGTARGHHIRMEFTTRHLPRSQRDGRGWQSKSRHPWYRLLREHIARPDGHPSLLRCGPETPDWRSMVNDWREHIRSDRTATLLVCGHPNPLPGGTRSHGERGGSGIRLRRADTLHSPLGYRDEERDIDQALGLFEDTDCTDLEAAKTLEQHARRQRRTGWADAYLESFVWRLGKITERGDFDGLVVLGWDEVFEYIALRSGIHDHRLFRLHAGLTPLTPGLDPLELARSALFPAGKSPQSDLVNALDGWLKERLGPRLNQGIDRVAVLLLDVTLQDRSVRRFLQRLSLKVRHMGQAGKLPDFEWTWISAEAKGAPEIAWDGEGEPPVLEPYNEPATAFLHDLLLNPSWMLMARE